MQPGVLVVVEVALSPPEQPARSTAAVQKGSHRAMERVRDCARLIMATVLSRQDQDRRAKPPAGPRHNGAICRDRSAVAYHVRRPLATGTCMRQAGGSLS